MAVIDGGGERARIGRLEEMRTGSTQLVEIGQYRVCLARTHEGDVFAVDDTCSHEEESLSEGWVDDGCIECPAHNSVFDLRTGEARSLPATEPVAVYRVTIEGGDVFVTVPSEA